MALQNPPVFLYLFLWAVNIGVSVAATSTKQFDTFYPAYGFIFKKITADNCSDEYHRYLAGHKNYSDIDWMSGAGPESMLTQPLVDCILNHTSESLKSRMTGAQVLLGVMPTVLAFLGPSHDEIAMLANVGRRPLLAGLVALASPSAYFSRAFAYFEPHEILSQGPRRRKQWCPRDRLTQLMISGLEYCLAVAACANVINNTNQVNLWTINSVSSDTDFFPGLWLYLALANYIFGCVVFRLRLRGERSQSIGQNVATSRAVAKGAEPVSYVRASTFKAFLGWLTKTGPRLRSVAVMEFIPCCADQYAVRIVAFEESKIFLGATWWQSNFTILHVVFGTLIFASSLFVCTEDALGIVGRYMVSVIVGRAILTYELAGMREKYNPIDGVDVRRNSAGEAGTSENASLGNESVK